MSTGLTVSRADEALAYFQAEAGRSWRNVLEAVFGATEFTLQAPQPASEPHDCVWFGYDFTPQLGCSAFGLNRTTAIALGRRFLSAKNRPSEHDHHAVHAASHLIGQLAASLASCLSSQLQTVIGSAESLDTPDPSALHPVLSIAFGAAEHGGHFLFVHPADELIAALQGQSPASSVSNAPNPAGASRNLDLLLDVEMPVSICFGSTRLPLKAVTKLTTGSIIELNRALSEPIHLVVNDCSIAQAEVVVVDGKFGVRITEIMSRGDRLRSLA